MTNLEELDRLLAASETDSPAPWYDDADGDVYDDCDGPVIDAASSDADIKILLFLRNNAPKMSAELRALRALVPLLKEATDNLGDPEESGYGSFTGGDPRDFTPDPDGTTEEELAKWKAACEAFAAAEARGERPTLGGAHQTLVDDDGRPVAFVSFSGFGLGIQVYRDEELAALLKKASDALSAVKAAQKGEK